MPLPYATLKQNGWSCIKSNYWYVVLADFLIAIIVQAASGVVSGILSAIMTAVLQFTAFGAIAVSGGFDSNSETTAVIIAMITYFIFYGVILVLSLALSAFVTEPMNVGRSSYYLKNRTRTATFTDIFNGVTKNYKNVAKVCFFRVLYVFLWSMLFVVPGIIKSLEYSQVPFILAENPDIEYKTALSLSSRLVYGHKFDICLFYLSFIGWYLLGAFAMGIGQYFVNPYYNSSRTELYEFLKVDAVGSGRVAAEELTPYVTPVI